MRKKILSLVICFLTIPSALLANSYSYDRVSSESRKMIRIFLNTGYTVDFYTSEIDSITSTSEEQRIWKNNSYRSFTIEDIDSICYVSPKLRLTTKSLDFGKVTVDYVSTTPVTLTNTSNYPATYMMLADEPFSVKDAVKEFVIMSGQSLTIDLTFNPKEVKKYNTKLIIASNSAESGMVTLPLSGEGVATVYEEEEVNLPPTEHSFDIVMPENDPLESFDNFKIVNFYGEFSAQAPLSAKGVRKIKRAGTNYNAFSSSVPVSSNGLQFHSFVDGQGNPYLFSISLPNERPEISFSQTAITLLMSSADLTTSNETDYRNAVKVIKNLNSFPNFVQQVANAYYKGKNQNMCPDYSTLNYSPIFNELYHMFKDNHDLTLSGVSLKSVHTTPLSATFRLRNDLKRTIHAYPSRVRMNENNLVLVEQEDAAVTFDDMLNTLLNEAFKQAEEVDIPLLDSEDIEFINAAKSIVDDIKEEEIAQNPALGQVFKFHLPYILKSSSIDYIDALGDCFDALVYNIGKETSIFEAESGTIEVPFNEFDKIFVDVYGAGLPNDKSWSDFTQIEQTRIILALIWGSYLDYIKPFWELVTGLKKADAAWNANYKFDLRYGARKYPEWALIAKLFHEFVKNRDNITKLINNLNKHDAKAILLQLADFVWNQLKKIPSESDNPEDKRTYVNLIYNIVKKTCGYTATSEAFRQSFKAGANKFLGSVNFIFKGMDVAESGVDLYGAIYALRHSNLKDTHIIDKYSKPYINIKEPTVTYLTPDVTVHFEWDTFKGNTYGEYLYDLEMMVETPTSITQTAVLTNISATSCDYTLKNLSGAQNAMKIYYRLKAHNPANTQTYVLTDFVPLMWKALAEPPEMVDLGLPSGTLWAQRNLGASSAYDYGNYYAWGETETKTSFSWKNYKYCKGTQNSLTKYCTKSTYGKIDNVTKLDATDDMMKAKCGYYYSIPTKEDWEELFTYCTWSRLGEVVMVRGSNNNIIVLPLTGYRNGLNLYDCGTDGEGYYWTSTLDKNSPDDAWFMHMNFGKHELKSYYRSQGRCIRPVMRKNEYVVTE